MAQTCENVTPLPGFLARTRVCGLLIVFTMPPSG